MSNILITLPNIPSSFASGNVLYVSPSATNSLGASIASDSWTRAQALGRQDRPFVTFAAAYAVANTNDIIYCTNYNANIEPNNSVKPVRIIIEGCAITTLAPLTNCSLYISFSTITTFTNFASFGKGISCVCENTTITTFNLNDSAAGAINNFFGNGTTIIANLDCGTLAPAVNIYNTFITNLTPNTGNGSTSVVYFYSCDITGNAGSTLANIFYECYNCTIRGRMINFNNGRTTQLLKMYGCKIISTVALILSSGSNVAHDVVCYLEGCKGNTSRLVEHNAIEPNATIYISIIDSKISLTSANIIDRIAGAVQAPLYLVISNSTFNNGRIRYDAGEFNILLEEVNNEYLTANIARYI